MTTLRFFRKKPQFKEPPKILLDLAFITNMNAHKKTEHHVSDLLFSSSSLYTTCCVARELGYGSEARFIKALNIKILGCKHEGKVAEADCLLSYIQGGNDYGYFVGTAQEEFVPHLQQLPWVPIIQAFGKKMCLRKPSAIQIQYADEEENVECRGGSLRGRGRGLRGGARGGHGGGRDRHGGGR